MIRTLTGTALLLLFAIPGAAQDASTQIRDFSTILKRVNETCKRDGVKVAMDAPEREYRSPLRKETNRIYFHTDPATNKTSRIVIEPITEAPADINKLAGAMLYSVNAVTSLEEGIRMAVILTNETEVDGKARSITLQNGIKLARYKNDYPTPRFVITL